MIVLLYNNCICIKISTACRCVLFSLCVEAALVPAKCVIIMVTLYIYILYSSCCVYVMHHTRMAQYLIFHVQAYNHSWRGLITHRERFLRFCSVIAICCAPPGRPGRYCNHQAVNLNPYILVC